MESLFAMSPTARVVIIAACAICVIVLFAKAVKFVLKLAVIAVMLLFVAYFLIQEGVIPL